MSSLGHICAAGEVSRHASKKNPPPDKASAGCQGLSEPRADTARLLDRVGPQCLAPLHPEDRIPPADNEGGGGGRVQPGPIPPGLVSSSTSHKVVIDARESRLRRMSRAVRVTARAIQDSLQAASIRYRAALITCTYAPGVSWSPKDISKLTNHYRMWAKSRRIRVHGVWVLELTQAGRPHYHVLLFIPRGFTPPMPDKQGWWRKGMTNVKWARKPVAYLAKYASKAVHLAGCLPKGARLHGHIGLTGPMWGIRSWYMAPAWLRRLVERGHRVVKRGGWWRDTVTRIEYRSPWVFDSLSGGHAVLRWVGWSIDDVRFAYE